MTASENFSRPGAVDLSSIAASTSASEGHASAYYVTDLTEANFQQTAALSARYPVILLVISGKDAGCQATKDQFIASINQQSGRMLGAIADIDVHPRIAQALGVQAVPTCIALLAGQLAPLFQGTKQSEEISAVLAQVHQAAVANGLTGRAEPQPAPAGAADGDGQPALDPRFAAADKALQDGDFAKAVEEFDHLLATNPRDAEAAAGKAQASLLMRTVDVSKDTVAKANENPDDLDAQLKAADVEILAGAIEQGFDRLLGLMTGADPQTKETIRQRLVELFVTCDPGDPAVKKARRALAMALF